VIGEAGRKRADELLRERMVRDVGPICCQAEGAAAANRPRAIDPASQARVGICSGGAIGDAGVRRR